MAGTTAIEYDDGCKRCITTLPGYHCVDHAGGKVVVLLVAICRYQRLIVSRKFDWPKTNKDWFAFQSLFVLMLRLFGQNSPNNVLSILVMMSPKCSSFSANLFLSQSITSNGPSL